MKLIINAIIFFSLFCFRELAVAEEDKKDWVLDLKTSTLIPNYIGKAKIVRGKVIVGEKELEKGDKIYPQGKVKTGEKSFVVFELIDETIVTLGPHSEFEFESWAYRTKNDRDAIFSLILGKMRAEIKVKTKEADQIKIKSSLVAMGIRGTDLLVNNSQVANKMVTQVALLEGKVTLLSTPAGEKIDLIPNEYVEVEEGKKDFSKNKRRMGESEVKNLVEVLAPNEKRLLDYPREAKHEAASESAESAESEDKIGDGEEIGHRNTDASEKNEKVQSSEKKVQQKSWKVNLKKLNELRDEAAH